MPNQLISKITVPVNDGGTITNETFDIKDAAARQSIAELGSLAFKDNASGTYTPAGSITVNEAADTTASVPNVTAVGTLPSLTYDSTNEELTFSTGTLPTLGTPLTVVIASGARTASFAGTEANIIVS